MSENNRKTFHGKLRKEKKRKLSKICYKKEKKKGTFCFTITEGEDERFPICFQSHPVRQLYP